ncbi:MAG: glycosyltransferase family 4 protein, partial [Gammaproteobacteria bacterium]|nr:glycosyltransferase family 4 protein [Gammaproteobacteria bacterium]
MLVPFLHEIGGMERQAIQLAQTLREQGVEVVIITGLYLEDYFKGRRSGLRWQDSVAGVPVYRVPVTRLAWRLRLIAFACFALILLATKLRRFQLIHAHQLISTGLAGAIIGWLLRRSVIVKIASGGYVGDLVTLRRAFFGRPPIKFLGQRLDRIICLTSQIRTELLAVGFPAEKMTVIPNGVDTTNFCPTSDQNRDRLRDKLGLPDQSKLVLFIGGLKPKKRAAFLLSAWHVVQQEKVNAHLLFIGKGPLRPELEAQCK